MTSVLGKTRSEQLSYEPFAHLVADRALDDALYQKLARDFPPPQRFTRGLDNVDSNQAIRIPAKDVVDNPEFSAEWREFFRYHSSQEFWDDIVRVMGDALRQAHPDLERRSGKPLEEWTVKRRGMNDDGDVELDAQFVINTPVRKPSSVRPAHVDTENEIFAGLLYMRPEDDTTPGGDLALYHFTSPPRFGGHYAKSSDIAEDKLVPYGANRFVAFINSAESLHGVMPRPQTDRFRRYINFIASTPYDAFSLPKMSRIDHFLFWLARRGTKSRGVQAKTG